MSEHMQFLLENACSHAEQGNFAAASAHLHALLALAPAHPAALQMLGLVQVRQGDLRAAARTLRHACMVAPDHALLHVQAARVEWEIGLPAQAAAAYQQAIALGCAAPDVLVDCAVALGALKRHAAALEYCETALSWQPGHLRALKTSGTLLHAMGRFEEALACHDQALAAAPDVATWAQKALTLDAMGQLDQALACHDQALALAPDDAAIVTHRGATLTRLGMHDAARDCHALATELDPAHATAWSNLGASLCRCGRLNESIAAHDKAVSLLPSSPDMWVQRAATLMAAKRYPEALASCNAAIRLSPVHAQAWCHRGMVLWIQGRNEEALDSVEEACSLDIGCINATSVRVEILNLLGRHAEALAWLEQAVSRQPDDQELRFAFGTEQLKNGDFARGWANYQAYRTRGHDGWPRHAAAPLWSGAECLQGKRLIVYAEQGHGDIIQFCRFIPQLAAQACTVYFVVYPGLRRLLATLGGCRVLAYGEPLPAADFHIPLMALPQALCAGLGNIPASTPYLHARGAHAGTVLPASGIRIGIACSGNPAHPGNPRRSVPLAAFGHLQKYGTVAVLQNVLQEEDAAWLREHPGVLHPVAGVADYAVTAQVIASMDLVISVDTSIAHLAGAMDKPLWLLLPRISEWRWLTAGTSSPWYPSARLFRQPVADDWQSVICEIEKEVGILASHARELQKGAA